MDIDRDREEEWESTEGQGEETVFPQPKKPGGIRPHLLLMAQGILCVLVVLAAFVIKGIGGELHAAVAGTYFQEYRNSVFTGTSEPSLILREDAVITEVSKKCADDGDRETLMKTLREQVKHPLKEGVLTSGFGQRERDGETESHKGIDWGADVDTPIKAAFDGQVIAAEEDPSYGKYLILAHGDQVQTLYAHCNELLVQTGDRVQAGDTIATVGETGDAEGAHLHFELIVDGEKTDPSFLFRETEE